MGIRMAPPPGGASGPGDIPKDRMHAISEVIKRREERAMAADTDRPLAEGKPASTSSPSDTFPTQADTPARGESSSQTTQTQLPSEALIEIERRERQMDQLKHELAMRDAEIERRKASEVDGKDWRRLLAMHGHTPDDIVADYLGGKTEPVAKNTESDPVATRLEQLERKLQETERERERQANEWRSKQEREARLNTIRGLTPENSEDFEVMNSGKMHDYFLSQIENIEKQEKRSIGPQELSKFLKEFEGNTRKNLEGQVRELAKTSFGRKLLTELIKSAKPESTSESAEVYSSPTSGPSLDPTAPSRVFRLARQETSDSVERAKQTALQRWRGR